MSTEGTKPRTGGNKAHRDKDSILTDVKCLLKIYYPVYQRMAKIDRIEGAAMEFRTACWDMIGAFSVAKECPEVRTAEIHKMFAAYGRLVAAFDLIRDLGLTFPDKLYLMAERLARIEEGIRKWRNSLR